jgi:hypothetical protein
MASGLTDVGSAVLQTTPLATHVQPGRQQTDPASAAPAGVAAPLVPVRVPDYETPRFARNHQGPGGYATRPRSTRAGPCCCLGCGSVPAILVVPVDLLSLPGKRQVGDRVGPSRT